MSKVQIEKDLKELYGEANLNLQLEEYYKKKRKDMLLLLLVIIGILIISFVTDEQQRKIENNNLTRNIKGQGKKEYQLEIKVSEEEWQPFSVILEEKEYTLEEIEVLAEGAMEKLCQAILNENESLSAVENNLNLIVQFDEYPFVIQWESTKPEFIDNDGVLNFENIRKPEIVDLKVELQYGLWKKEEKISITVLPKSKEDTLYYLKHKIQKSQSEDKETSNFHLPEIYDSKNLQWRYPSNNSTKVILVLCLLLVPFISYQKDMEIHRITKIRKEELLYSFPDFISRLILYLEAGMSVQGSLFRMEQEYKKKKIIYLKNYPTFVDK
ncbi:MAG: hypothetical protein IKW30_04155 [Lachnospiraceae bacterium]|nr:hypothetical protein [Lachnospiraceae bacterium]